MISSCTHYATPTGRRESPAVVEATAAATAAAVAAATVPVQAAGLSPRRSSVCATPDKMQPLWGAHESL